MFGGYASFGATYYLTPFLGVGADLRYDMVSRTIRTDHAKLDLSSASLQLRLSHSF